MKQFKTGVSLTLATALISGFSIWLNAYGVTGINPGVFTGLKNIGVGLILLAVILVFRQFHELRTLSRRSWLRLISIGLIGGSVPFVLFFNGLVMTTAGRAGFIQKTMFIYVALLAAAFLKERITKYAWVGIAALAIGQVLFLQTIPRSYSTGDLMIFAAALLWAIEMVISKKALQTMSPDIVIWGRMFFGGLFIWIYLVMTGAASSATVLSTQQWLWVAVTTLILVAYVLTLYHGLARVPAHVAASILTLGAPVTVTLQALYTDKTISLPEVGGIVLMLAALVWLISLQRQPRTSHVLTDHNQ
ncbi:MAG: DMT family transporter [Candidatus Komeilibacteria bacterium]|nr:DMT family transporter [Candidatus Komeilibacteria bacterium]